MPRARATSNARRLALVAALGALSTTAQPHAQFRAGTTLVLVDAAVTGPDGAVVRDLTVVDVELLVDGARMTGPTFRGTSRRRARRRR